MLGTRSSTENLPPQFITAIRALFDLLDTTHSGYIKYSEFAVKWQESSAYSDKELPQNGISRRHTEMLPKNFLHCLRAVTPPNGMLTFERFCRGLRLALANPSAPSEVPGIRSSQPPSSAQHRPIRSSSVRESEEPSRTNFQPATINNQKAVTSPNSDTVRHRVPAQQSSRIYEVNQTPGSSLSNYGSNRHVNGNMQAPSAETRNRAQKWRYRYSGATSDSEDITARRTEPETLTNGHSHHHQGAVWKKPESVGEGSVAGSEPHDFPQGYRHGTGTRSLRQNRSDISQSSGQLSSSIKDKSGGQVTGKSISNQISRLITNGQASSEPQRPASLNGSRGIRPSRTEPSLGPVTRLQPLTSISVDTRLGHEWKQESRHGNERAPHAAKQFQPEYQTEVYPTGQGLRRKDPTVPQSSSGSSARNSDISSIRHSPLISPNPAVPDHSQHPTVSHAAPVLTRTLPPTYSQTMTNRHQRSDSNQSIRRTVVPPPKPASIADAPPFSASLLRGGSTENLTRHNKPPLATQPLLGTRSISQLTAGDLEGVKLRNHSATQIQADRSDGRRHTATELSLQLSSKHKNLLNEERDLVKRGLDMATKLRNWYSERLQTLDRKQKLFANKNHPMEFAVQEQRLNYFRAHVAELNRHIVSLMDSKEKNFPSHLTLEGGRSAAQPAEDQVRWLIQQNKQLTLEVSEKSERLSEVENEKKILLQQIAQTHRPVFPIQTNPTMANGHVQYSLM